MSLLPGSCRDLSQDCNIQNITFSGFNLELSGNLSKKEGAPPVALCGNLGLFLVDDFDVLWVAFDSNNESLSWFGSIDANFSNITFS
jgi:hypothetical protein